MSGEAPTAAPGESSEWSLMLKWIQQRIILSGFDGTFTAEQDEKSIAFVSDPNMRRLLAVMVDGKLQMATDDFESLATSDAKEIVYFIRPENQQLTSTNIGTLVEFGCVGGSAAHSLLRLMNGVFSAQIFKSTAWPDSVKKDFTGHYHRFMASLTETANSAQGKTVLYLPGDEIPDVAAAAKDKDFVQQLESIAIHWTRQIKEVVNNHDNAYNAEISGPIEEISFWRSRTIDLSGISEQLHRPDVKKVISVLEAAKSSYLGPFVTLSERIREGSMEAENNLKFLELITEPCQKLAEAEPKNIPEILPSLLHCIRMISTLSKFYNTEDRLTGLLRKISNQIIRRCCDKISLDEIFNGDIEESMICLDQTIKCGVAWKNIYRRTARAINMNTTSQKWKFDEASIFAQIDAFVQRCRDLLEVCEGQIQFARKNSSTKGESGPLPEFGGTKGGEITKSLLDIEASFETQIERLRRLDYEILDVKTSKWHDDYNFFKNGVKDLEVMYQNVIKTAFDDVAQVSAGVVLLEIFYSLAKRESIKRCVEKKTAEIFALFITQCQGIRSEFDEQRKAPPLRPNEPQYAGTALWARSLSTMVKESWTMLQEAKYLVPTREAEEAEEVFKKLMGVLDDFKSQHYQHWVETLDEIDSSELQRRLEQPLIKKVTTVAESAEFGAPLGHLVCNFDQQLLALFTEVHYWEKFHGEFIIPYVAHDICNQREKLRVMREHVMLVVRAYNDILSDLTTDERRLFTDHIRRLDKRINQGLTKLTWASRGVTEYYVRDCCAQSTETHDIVQQFHSGKDVISKNCKQVSSLMLVKIDKNMVYDEGVFEVKQSEHRERAKAILEKAHHQIKMTMKEMYVNFKDGSGEVRREWRSFCVGTDAAVELALRTTVKKSLQELSKAINGDAKTEPQTLFRVNIVLENNRVDYRPTMINLTHVVNIVAKELISCLGVVPRLKDAVLSDEADTVSEEKKDSDETYYKIISNDDDTLKIVVQIMNGMSASATELQKYLSYWDRYKPLWEMDKESFIRRYAKANRPLKSYDNDVTRHKEQQADIQGEEISHTINFIKIDCTLLKTSLVNHCVVWQNKLTGLLNQNALQQLRDLHLLFEDNTKRLTTPPLNLKSLSESINKMRELKADLPEIEKKFAPLDAMYNTLQKFEVQITDEEHDLLENLQTEWNNFNQMLVDVEKMLDKSKVNMKRDLETSVEDYGDHVKDLRKEVVVSLPYKAELTKEEAFAAIDEYKKKSENAKAIQLSLKPGLDIFGIELPDHKEMRDTERDLDLMSQIWNLSSEWDSVWDKWRGGLFRKLDVEEMENQSGVYTKTIGKLRREIAAWGIWGAMKEKIEQFKQTLPLIQDLRSEALRPRHWANLKKEINKEFDPESSTFTLDNIFSLGLHNYAEFIGEMSANANKELNIERSLADIETRWADVVIDIAEYKEIYFKIRSTEDLFQLLEDDSVALSTMKASKYYNSFKEKIDFWEGTLSTISEIVDMILTVQRKWMYLESIFMAAGDISKQLPEEYTLFVQVNDGFKSVMGRVFGDPNAQSACGVPGMLDEVTDFDNKLEKIQKSLDQYLETKRVLFPRFYFVSDDDLLEILGQSKEPQLVQKHIKKCFEGIKTLILVPPGKLMNRTYEASGGTSPDGETMSFVQNVVVDGAVELWLVAVEAAMKLGLQKLLAGCIQEYKGKKKENWVKAWQGGLLITTGAIGWTSDCSKALNNIAGGNKGAMKTLKKKQVGYLNRLTDLVRDPKLQKIDRKKTVALITMEIHNRDVMERMIKANCTSVNDFDWLSQLRFIFNKEEGDFGTCIVKQTNCTLSYSYEYQGNNGRLVVTPLTDRCVLTLLTAMFLHRGGNPLGPAGTGKTETVKDLGKNLAKYVVVINCSDGMDYKSVGRIFSGLCQSGSWGCFDEFNRIKIEVISVVAMQVLSIVNAQRLHQERFNFMGQFIKCSTEAGMFITMNPGYAGRTELPDNLKALMRPVAMMAPDLNLIAEVMLAAEGFAEARLLAKKTITLYNLMQQQLSKQDHYDYGLRNLKAVLNMAGSLKRADASVNEESILMRALRDMNLPKFIEDDLKLFRLLLGDLFPGLDLPVSEYGSLSVALNAELEKKGLQKHPFLLGKIIQLYDSQLTRHCNMLVGSTMSGKTTVWKTLTEAKTTMSKAGEEDVFPVNIFVINSKSITLSELYGAYDLQTFEWADGILSTTFKQCAESDKPDEKWILFDGPVDAMWIESMNSVMDDNKILTLINGDRIPLTNSMALLFEVEDLAVASPATVSRAGMIYIDAASMGYGPFVESWITKKFGEDNAEDATFHRDLFTKYVEKVLAFKEVNCNEAVPITDFNAVKSLIFMYDTVAVPANGVEKVEGEPPQKYQQICEKWFVFSMIWTVMAAVDENGRVMLDQFLREIEAQFPPMQTVYDYFVDPKKQDFELWETKLPNWRPRKGMEFSQLIVPTIDTVRNQYVLTTLVNNRQRVLVSGTTGTGKTVLCQSMLTALPENQSSLIINFSSATDSGTTQAIVESVMEKRSKDKVGPSGGKQMVLFIDDFNMPKKTNDESPFQPPLELLRLWMDYGGWYDRIKCTWRYVLDTHIVTAMAPPTGGREVISARTQSRFSLLYCTEPSDAQIVRIFESILAPKLSEFENEIKPMGGNIARATLGVYKDVVENFLPTPAKSHYLFNMRDIAKVVQGIVQCDRQYIDTKDSASRLWVHECMRAFSDRFLKDSANDEKVFITILSKYLKDNFDTSWDSLMDEAIDQEQGPVFASFMKESGDANILPYEEVQDMSKLKHFLEEKLEDYNMEPKLIPMNLVLFDDAIKHISRIHRILFQSRGNMMLVGVGGSGRQSLTRLASYVAEIDTFTIEITKQYRSIEFREDLKNMYLRAGVDNKVTTFLFNDTQIKEESFLEDINNILSSGEVPNLFPKEELGGIYDGVRKGVAAAGLDETPANMWKFFINRVRSNLHVVLAMSPIGAGLRTRCRMYPGLVNCTTIDWFHTWPADALQEVAMKFLADVKLDEEKHRGAIATVFASTHLSVITASDRMIEELKRYNYVTPTNYLELVKGYLQLLAEKRGELGEQRNKLSNGLEKLEESKEQVEVMSKELELKKVVVAQSQKECEELLVVIVSEKRIADEQKKTVEADSIRIGKEETECLAIAADAEADLAVALPALEKAMKEVDKLDKGSISEVKAYASPPKPVATTLECVMILMGKPTDWANAKKALGASDFLAQVKGYDKNNVKDSVISKVKKYVNRPDFTPEAITGVSSAAGALCTWCHAIFLYANVAKEVAPKRARLKGAQQGLAVKQKALKEAKDALAIVEAKVADLNANFNKSKSEEQALKDEAEMLEDNLNRAEKLIDGLSGEYVRWQASVGGFEKSIKDLVGDSLIASGFLSYAGPFDTVYRESLVGQWIASVKTSTLPFSENFMFSNFLAKPTDVRDWNIQGLPADQFSTENGVIVNRCSRWPLMIDPQGQANKWIRNMEGKDLKIIDLKMKDFLRDVENAITYGLPILLQDVLEELDPSLEPVLSKAIIKVGNRQLIKLGDKELDYSNDFKLYITTKMQNPHYTPEVSTKTTVVNFSVKQQGLEEQLLGTVVHKENKNLEDQKSDLTVRVAAGKRKLVDLEDEILRLLSESTGSLLEDVELVKTLQVSKVTSEEVNQQLKIAEETEIKIDTAREGYRSAAIRSAIAYFVLNDMARVDPMYQFSLDAYVDLFEKSIDDSREKGIVQQNVKDRVETINTHHTLQVYRTTCVGLFERHKLLFSLQLCIKIMQRENKIPQSEFDFFCFGGVVVDRSDQKGNSTTWIDEAGWDNVCELEKMGAFNGLVSSIEQAGRDWKSWYMSAAPEKNTLPGDWDNKLSELQQMCVLRSLRPDRVLFAANIFVGNNMGPEYADPPAFNLGEIYKSSTNKTPLIFILSPGVDPTASVQQLADQLEQTVDQVALGQGQGPVAMKALQDCKKAGTWLLLANCHLMLSWMPQLEKAVEAYCDEGLNGKINPKFRLWLSSSPSPAFPITLLQRGIKMTTEPPRGLRSNLLKLYNLVSDEKFAECGQQFKYKKLLFCLTWFHASLLERRKFKALGFNIPYEFNESDYLICHDLIIVLLDTYPDVTPFEAMRYLIADANYGGRVTDDWDRKLVQTYMKQFLCENAVSTESYPLCELPEYHVPADGDLKSYKDFIKGLPQSDHPAAFGQHPNADISSQIEDTNGLLGTIIGLQPKIIVEGAETPMQKLSKQVAAMKPQIPKVFNLRQVRKDMGARSDPDALKTVLFQEIERYNVLLARLARAMVDMEKATLGLVIVTPALEAAMNSLLEFSVPSNWHVAYPSAKGLASWVRDLVARIKQMSDWVNKELPKTFWLAGFTYPTGFLTALLQTTARKNGIAIDTLTWEFPIMTQGVEDIQSGAKEGAYITGMFLEGARWDKGGASLSEPLPMELTSPMPIVHFKPSDGKKKANKSAYACPVYMYPVRTGSRERPSYVCTVELKSGNNPSEFWIKRGVALLLSTAQ
ncbi:hypothetical protein TrVE_jg1168 [Triparma verrucosa]|uniref:Dynein-1, subspecies f n=1 Tax=Triparma verrucosa TaxID=1606542 RepID=A0A9W7CGH9_9STRA|nr:hypothetical protein TrVE_jg1168 [Triparma verrucosa]